MPTSRGRVVIDILGEQLLSNAVAAGVIPARIVEAIDLSNGTADGSIVLVYSDAKSSIAASTTTQYDLSGSMTNALGQTVVFAEVVLIAIRNTRQTALAYLTIGPHSSNGFGAISGSKGFWNAATGSGGGNVVPPALASIGNGWIVLYDPTGVPVTAGTGDILSVVTSGVTGSTNSWDLLILGRSA
jgi:hypothetical protein